MNRKSRIIRWLQALGPGIIIAALVFGPSKITITTKLGAEYGYSMIWIVAVAIFFMIIFTNMGARIGEASKISLLSSIRDEWGNKVAVVIGIGIFLVTTAFQAGNSTGVGIAFAEATGTSSKIWIILFNLIGIGLLFFRSFYKTLERLMITLVALMLLSFVATLFFVKPDFTQVASGFVPVIPMGSGGLIIAFMASCFSIVGAFYQSYLVQERKKIEPGEEKQNKGNSSIIGILILGVMSAMVLICAAAVLHPKGIKVNSATQMAKALKPLFGIYATNLFLMGFFGASFSSLIGNASVGGTLLGDALGYGSRLSSKITRGLIGLVMVCGAIIAIIFGKLPLELIVFAQSITIFLVPFIGIAMFFIANKKKIMRNYVNGTVIKFFGALGLVLVFLLAIYNVYDLFIK
ncbi:MAG: Nramp family divalent metal transporter [Ginsengibacter sp.]